MDDRKGRVPARPNWPQVAAEAAFAAVVAVALFAVGANLKLTFNPGALVGALVCPVPLVLVTIRHGPGVGGAMVGFAAGVLAAAEIPGASGLAFLLEIGVPALLLGLCMRRNIGPEWTVLFPAAALCAAFVIELGLRPGGIAGMGEAYREAMADLDRSLLEAQQFYEGLGGQGDMAAAAEMAAGLRAFARAAYPGVVAALNILATAAVSWLAMALAARTVATAVPAFTWALPEGMIWAFIGAAAAALAPWGPWRLIGLNALLVILVLYFLQGLSIAGYFTRRLELPWYVRLLAALMVALWPPLMALAVAAIIGVGLCDVWVAFRRVGAPPSSGATP